jgi:hypothetical protein
MNGRDETRLTTREAQTLLREKATDDRTTVQLRRAERRNRRHFMWFLSFVGGVGFVMIGLVIYSQLPSPRSAEADGPPAHGSFTVCIHGDCHIARFGDDDMAGWFDPRYGVDVPMPDQWQVGPHTYTTRDLMGRRL